MASISKMKQTSERGNALVMVIGLGFAFVIIGITLAMATTFAASTASNTRAGVQSQAAADGGIDTAITYLNSVALGSESGFTCSLGPTQTTTSQGASEVVTTLKYRKKGEPEGSFACDPGIVFTDGTEIVGAQLISKATLKTMTANGAKTTVRTVQQELDYTDSGGTSSLFNYGMFSNSDLPVTNNLKVLGADSFTNGNLACSNSATFESVTAVGNAVISNACVFKDLTIGGTFACTSSGGARIKGDFQSASNQLATSYRCNFDKNVTTAGPFNPQEGVIGGNLLAETGSINGWNATVGGWVQAGGSIDGVTAGGTRVPNTPTIPSAAPLRQDMPAISWDDLQGTPAGNPIVKTVKSWLNDVGNAVGTECPAEIYSDSNTYRVGNPAKPTVIDGRNCDMKVRGSKFQLEGDVTFVVKSWTTSNSLDITSTDPSRNYKLRIIVPLAAGSQSCAGGSSGNISHGGNPGFKVDPNIDAFFYTNGKVSFSNMVKFSGSVYGCEVAITNDVEITYEDLTPPGMGGPGGTHYDFKPVRRFDVR